MHTFLKRTAQLAGAGGVCYAGFLPFRRRGGASGGENYDYVIVGGGNAAGYACKEFVDQGVTKNSKVCMITSEAVLPYERPALSKGFLLKPKLDLPLFNTCAFLGERHQMDWYSDNNISVKLSTTVDKLDSSAKSLTATTGSGNEQTIGYKKLLLATGCSVIKFSDFMSQEKCGFGNIFYMRDIEDARDLKKTLSFEGGSRGGRKKECIIIGGGYIGMEIAAALTVNEAFRNDYNITMVFPEEHMMAARNLFDAKMGAKYHELYEKNGIKFICNDWDKIMVSSFEGDRANNVKSVVLKSGEKLAADMVVVGIGARPNTGLFREQLQMDKDTRGLKVNKYLQSSNSDVYGCGDIVSFECPFLDNKVCRLEHVRHARSSAMYAVRAMTDKLDAAQKQTGYEFLPVFYSRIFGQGWEFYGQNNKGDTTTVYCKDEPCSDPITQRAFKMCAIWSNAKGKVTAMFVDSSDGEDVKKAKELVAAKADLRDAQKFAAAGFGRKL